MAYVFPENTALPPSTSDPSSTPPSTPAPPPSSFPPLSSPSQPPFSLDFFLQMHHFMLSHLPPDLASEASDFTNAFSEYGAAAPDSTLKPSLFGQQARQQQGLLQRAIRPTNTIQHMILLPEQPAANVPLIRKNLRLDADGQFIETELISRANSIPSISKTSSSLHSESQDIEDQAMDKVRRISFR